MHFCVPFIIYAILVLLSLNDARNRNSTALLTHLGMLAILYVLCNNGYNTAAWLLLLWPFVLFFILVVIGVVKGIMGN